MAAFQHALLRLVAASLQTYQARNIDHLRFGTSGGRVVERLIEKLASVGLYRHSAFAKEQVDERINALESQWEGFEWLYARLANNTSRHTLVEVMAYRILGPRHVRIGAVYDAFWRGVSDLQGGMVEKARTQRVNMLDGWLDDFILNGHGFPVRLRAHKLNVLDTFLLEQYRLAAPGVEVEAKPGDVVVDGGGCWGDTALYFAHKVGAAGGVHVFEFSPANLLVLRRNLGENPALSSRIHLHEAALWNTSGAELAFNEAGPGTALGTGAGTFKAQTRALDEWAVKEGIPRVDYIKLDVEGAEGRVLKGASQVIQQHRPKLAVALYHSLADFTELPRLVDEIAPGYRFYLGHYTIHQEETILFATR